jgi:hypothetical protein
MPTYRSIPPRAAAILFTLCCAALAAGCGGGQGNTSASAKVSQDRFDAHDFAVRAGGSNQWLPLTPGAQWVRQGGTDVGHRRVPHRVIKTVTDVSRQVNGVRAVLVLDRDIDAGQVAQQSIDYLAQDKRGNVWSLGSYTEEYEGGRLTSIRDAWLAGVNGGRAGILMPANPETRTRLWYIAQPPGADPDVAQVVKTGQSHCVPFKCFKGVLVTREGKATAPDNEFKYYAAGVGQIDNIPRSASMHHDVEKLINLTSLSGQGLAEMSKEALTLDKHASVKKAAVFAHGAGSVMRTP